MFKIKAIHFQEKLRHVLEKLFTTVLCRVNFILGHGDFNDFKTYLE